MIGAILRAQFLSMRLGFGRGSVLRVVTGAIWYGLWTIAACAGFVWTSQAAPAELRRFLPLGFLAVCFYWQIIPVASAGMGSALDLRKLLIYPVPARKLFQVELLLRLTAGLEMIMVLTGAAAGLLRNPATRGWMAAPRIVAPVLLFVVFNVLLASGVRSLLERLFARRRVREVLFFGLLLMWMSTRLLVRYGFRIRSLGPVAFLVQSFLLPWNATAQTALGQAVLLPLAALFAWTLLAAVFGRNQFARSLAYDILAAQAMPLSAVSSRRAALAERFYRFPALFLRDPLAAIVEKELRSLARIARFRMVFVMGFSFGVMIWLPFAVERRGGPSVTGRFFLTIVCIYALTLIGQVSYWNCFGFDRSAVVFYFVAPQPVSRVLLGKNIAALTFIYLETLILTAVTLAFRVRVDWAQVAETLPVVTICAVYMLALGNISSVNYPRGLNPERVSQGGASNRFQALIFLVYPVALLPVCLAYLARYAFASQLMFVLVLGIAALIGAVLYAIAMESASGAAVRRREAILHELSKSDGPVSSD